jgi:hypothetical protein
VGTEFFCLFEVPEFLEQIVGNNSKGGTLIKDFLDQAFDTKRYAM